MKTAYCSQCHRVTIMTSTLTLVPIVEDAGKVRKTTIETYQCSSCGSFVCSRETGPEKPERQVGFIAKERRKCSTRESEIRLNRKS